MKKIGSILNNNDKYLEETREMLMGTDLKNYVSNCPDHDLPAYLDLYYKRDLCKKCSGLKDCKQKTVGYKPTIGEYEITVFEPCEFKKIKSEQLQKDARIETMASPRKILNANIKDFNVSTKERKDLLVYASNFISTYSSSNPVKGIYVSGMFGTGKTFLLAAIANELASKGYNCLLTYLPDLVRETLSKIATNEVEAQVKKLKTVECLFIDDIGSEANNEWFRDQVFGPVLQYRLLEELPTFFSSNYTIKELAQFLSNSKNSSDNIKSYRLIERIVGLTKQFKLSESKFEDL